MDSPTHVAIARWSAGHPALSSFLRLSDAELTFFATEPDMVYRDNVIEGDPDSRWYHSRKLDDSGVYVAGAVDAMLSSFGIEAYDARKEGDFERVRKIIALASHYAVDSSTPWHLTACMAKTHQEGEETLNLWVDDALADLRCEPVPLSRPRSIGGSVRDACRETWALFVPQMRDLKSGKELADHRDLSIAVLQRCAVFSLTVQLSILARALG